MAEIDGGTDMSDVTNIVAFLSQTKAPEKVISLRNVYFSQ
jgi:hypothetical protein